MKPEMKFSNSQNMSIIFCSVILITCKNQQMEDTLLVLIVFMISLHINGFKAENLENNFLNLWFF